MSKTYILHLISTRDKTLVKTKRHNFPITEEIVVSKTEKDELFHLFALKGCPDTIVIHTKSDHVQNCLYWLNRYAILNPKWVNPDLEIESLFKMSAVRVGGIINTLYSIIPHLQKQFMRNGRTEVIVCE